MLEVELSAGVIEYEDSGGDGPILVFIHGVIMDGSVWRYVVNDLQSEYRCIRPVLPLGSHRSPMYPDADLSLVGIAKLIGEFLEKLDLREVTLVQNDWGGAQILIAVGETARIARIARMVLTSCEAFENYPPAPARIIVLAAKVPGGLKALMTVLNTRLGRRGPLAWGWMSKRPVPKAVMDAWFRPATDHAAIRRDLAKYATSVPPKAELLRLAAQSASFEKPVLIAWATEDRMMPIKDGRRLAETFPNSEFVGIDDSFTLIPEDQPEILAAHIRKFLTRHREQPVQRLEPVPAVP